MTGQSEKLVYFTNEEVRILHPGYRIALNLEEEIVTLLPPVTGYIMAQCRFPHFAFRALCLLLKSPRGATFAEIYAACRCSEKIIRRVLAERDAADSEEFYEEVRLRYQHLKEVESRGGKKALYYELKAIRRAVKEKRSVHTLGRDNGFGWRVRPLPRQGYQLLRAPLAQLSPVAQPFQPQHVHTP